MEKLHYSLYISLKKNPRGYLEEPGERRPRGPLAQSTGATAPVRPRKRGPGRISAALLEPRARRLLPRAVGRVFAALLEPRARRLLPRAVASVPCRLQVPISGFGPLVLMKLLSKVNGYIIGL